MRGFCKIIVIFFLLISSVASSQNDLNFKVKQKTPEPGTRLSLLSKIAVKQVNKAMLTGNPDSVFYKYNRFLSAFRHPKDKHYVEKFIGKNKIRTHIFYPHKKNKHNSKLPVFILYHGGGFLWGTLDMYYYLARKLSKKLSAIIVLPDYRLAPKHPYPAATNDCSEVLEWVADSIDNMGGNKKSIGLIGESAGGNLALVVSVKNQQKTKPENISQLILYYPSTTMVDTNFDSRSYFFNDYNVWYVLNRPILEKIRNSYLQNTPYTSWQVSPLYAEYNKKTPPSLVITAQCDPLRDEGKALALKMQKNGVKTKYICYKKTIHGFVCLFPVIKQGRMAIRETKKFVDNYYEIENNE